MPVRNKKSKIRRAVKKIIFSTNIIAIILLFCSYLSWNVSTLQTNLFSYIGLGFGFILFLNIAYLIFWLIISKYKQALICLVAILLCYKPITTYFPLNLHLPKAPTESIKILTYNVQGFINERNKDSIEKPILEYIANTDADIVCLQEYLVSKTGQTMISQQDVNRLLNKYPYSSITGLESSGKYHIFGLACFSKYPIEETQEVQFESSYNGAAIYTINIDGAKYTVANVHLETNSIKPEDKKLYSAFIQNTDSVKFETVTSNIRNRLGGAFRTRAKQVEKVKQKIAELETQGTIICGDFNDTPISYAYHQMKDGLKDAYVSTGFGPGITYYERLFRFRIDYIMHSENINSYRAKVEKIEHSDHYPLRTWLELNVSN